MIAVDVVCRRGGFTLPAVFALGGSGITALCGASASGKTTLLRAIAGLEPGVSGSIRVGERHWLDGVAGRSLPAHRRAVGYVFQDARLFPHLTVAANLCFGLARAKEGSHAYGFGEVVEWLGLEALLGRMPHQLSGGQQRRVAVARALLSHPDVLLMDEPLAGLDREGMESLLPHLRHAVNRARIPTLYATHTQAELLALADEVLYLGETGLSFHGPLEAALLDLALPYVSRADSCNVLRGNIRTPACNDHLALIETPIGSFSVPGVRGAAGDPVRLLIPANAVSISVHPPGESSIVNIVPLTVRAVQDTGNPGLAGLRNLMLEGNSTRLLARLTAQSVAALRITVGVTVYAQIKAAAMYAV